MTVCEEHFGVGTQGRVNLEEAVRKVNRVSGVDIQISIEEGPHLTAAVPHADGLYAKPPIKSHPNERMRVEMTNEDPVGGRMKATGSVYHFFEDYNGKPEWRWGGRGRPTPRKSDYVVVAIQSNINQGYPAYFNNPSEMVDEAPPIWVLSHEIGHAFHFSHDSDREFKGTLKRPLAEQLFLGLAPDRSNNTTIFHRGTINTGGVSALSKALLRHYYPTSNPTPRDASSQWYNHEILVVESASTESGIDGLGFPNYNPPRLRHDAASDLYHDCATGERPVYRMQYSDASDRNCQLVREPEVHVAFTFNGGYLETRSHENEDCEVDFIQYDWRRTLSIRGSQVGVPPAGGTREIVLCAMVDPGGQIHEFDESDNEVCMPVTLFASNLATAECPRR